VQIVHRRLYFHVPRDFKCDNIESVFECMYKKVCQRMHTNLLGNPSCFTGLFDCPLNTTLGITTIKSPPAMPWLSVEEIRFGFRLQCRFWVLELNVLIRNVAVFYLFLVLLWVVHGQNQDLTSVHFELPYNANHNRTTNQWVFCV
jgi:hypothetical protein